VDGVNFRWFFGLEAFIPFLSTHHRPLFACCIYFCFHLTQVLFEGVENEDTVDELCDPVESVEIDMAFVSLKYKVVENEPNGECEEWQNGEN